MIRNWLTTFFTDYISKKNHWTAKLRNRPKIRKGLSSWHALYNLNIILYVYDIHIYCTYTPSYNTTTEALPPRYSCLINIRVSTYIPTWYFKLYIVYTFGLFTLYFILILWSNLNNVSYTSYTIKQHTW